jgi:hypothetical protein
VFALWTFALGLFSRWSAQREGFDWRGALELWPLFLGSLVFWSLWSVPSGVRLGSQSIIDAASKSIDKAFEKIDGSAPNERLDGCVSLAEAQNLTPYLRDNVERAIQKNNGQPVLIEDLKKSLKESIASYVARADVDKNLIITDEESKAFDAQDGGKDLELRLTYEIIKSFIF